MDKDLTLVLVNSNLPLALNTQAQERVLEKIHFNTAKNTSPAISNSVISQELQTLLNKAVKLQQHKVPILITGESGVGKDHFVRLLRQAGARKDAPLIAINCASIPRDLIESELFGYEAGSFTGAKSSGKAGKFMQADKGILFLDEIGDMSLDLQSTLLRVLENSEFTPVGGSKPIRVDVQVVAATNVKLSEAVAAGRFRRDLYYRLNGCTCHLQPLRDNPDKKTIVQHILQREINIIAPDGQLQICPEVIELIEQHPWSGNIRQLISVIRATLYTASNSYITVKDLPIDFLAEMDNPQQHSMPSHSTFMTHPPAVSLTDWEFHGIKTALQHCAGNISMAAKKLGITRTTLYKKMDRFGLSREGEDYVL